ncbi:MAG: L,D-transpeptidase family protein [Sulfurimonas sp.]
MVKSFLIIIISQMFVFAGEQIIIVIADDYNSTKAKLYSFEDGAEVFDPFLVNVGRGGLGFGVGEVELFHTDKEPLKHEGDKRAPIGIFNLSAVFGYEKDLKNKMPYIHATKELICVDDSDSKFYNQIIKKPKNLPKSFEEMRREDSQYKLGVVVEHNKEQLKQRGSCIFIHVEKSQNEPTAGCTSMKIEDLKKIIEWLEKAKNPILIQTTKKELEQVLKLYPALKL